MNKYVVLFESWRPAMVHPRLTSPAA